jgi:hypothetical protein
MIFIIAHFTFIKKTEATTGFVVCDGPSQAPKLYSLYYLLLPLDGIILSESPLQPERDPNPPSDIWDIILHFLLFPSHPNSNANSILAIFGIVMVKFTCKRSPL